MYVETHAQARTTPAMREAIQQARGSVAELARQFGVSEQTIRKWRRREGVADHSHRPERLRTTLDAVQEDLAVGLRVGLRLPLDELLNLIRTQLNSAASRSAIDRTLRRRGVSRLDLLRPALPSPTMAGSWLLLSLVPIRSQTVGASKLLLARCWPQTRVAITHLPPRWRDLWVWLQPLLPTATGDPLRLLAGVDLDWNLSGLSAPPAGNPWLPASQQQTLWRALQGQLESLALEPPGRTTEDDSTSRHCPLDHAALQALALNAAQILTKTTVERSPRRVGQPAK